MEIKNLLPARSREELREWLLHNHRTETECWVMVKRGKPKDATTFWYIDAVEEALCFGWIDSTVKKTTEGLTVQKLSPRKSKSNWTELNKERCRRLERLGRMTDAAPMDIIALERSASSLSKTGSPMPAGQPCRTCRREVLPSMMTFCRNCNPTPPCGITTAVCPNSTSGYG